MGIHALTARLVCRLQFRLTADCIRYTSSTGTSEQFPRVGLEYALQARNMVDADRPSIDGLQTLLLLTQTFFAHNLGKKTYMTFGMSYPFYRTMLTV